MERTHIKRSFVGFAHRVAPLQNVFRKECFDVDLDTDVLEFFSSFQNVLVGSMMDGACAIAQHRGSKDVSAEDLLCHLDTQWNLDPLLMSGNCNKTCYRVSETTNTTALSLSPEPLPRKKTKRCSSNVPKVRPASLKVIKNSKISKLKSKCGQSVTKSKSRANSKCQNISSERPFKNHQPNLNKKPELKDERQPSVEMTGADSCFEMFRNKFKPDICNVDDGVPGQSSIVSMCKPSSKVEKIPTYENSIKVPPVKGNIELKLDIPVWFCLDSETQAVKISGLRQVTSIVDAVPKSQEAPVCNLKSKVDKQSSTCERSIKVLPFEEKIEPKIEVPLSISFDSEAQTFIMAGLGQDVSVADSISKQSPGASICKSKLKVEKKNSTNGSLIKVLPFKGKTEPEFNVPPRINFGSETLTFRKSGTKDFFKQSPDACKHKSNVEKMPICEHSKNVFSSNEKFGSEFKFAKQISFQRPQDSQVFKIPGKKVQQEVSDVKCTSVKTLEEARLSSVEMTHPDLNARKVSFKRRKREVFCVNDAPIETPEEARRKLAIVLLRIAGRY